MRPGKLRHVVTIQELVETRDTKGGITKTASIVTTRRARMETFLGDETLVSQQRFSQITHKFTMRYDSVTSCLTTKNQFLFETRTFDIKSIINTRQENKEIVFLCEEDI